MAERAAWRWRGVGIGVALVTLAGCATATLPEESRRSQVPLWEAGRATEELRREVTALRRELSEVSTQVQAVPSELQERLREGEARQRAAFSTLEQRLAATENRVEGFADALAALESSIGALGDQVARLEAVASPTQNGGFDGKRERRHTRAASVPLSAEELFDRAMESFRSGELGQSVLEFEEFVGKNPSHPLVGSARFWIGEAYYRAREYQHAAVEYQKAVDAAPSGENTAEALLKLGLAHRALKREDRAREAWTRLLRDFSESDAAQKGRSALREPPRPGKGGVAGDTR